MSNRAAALFPFVNRVLSAVAALSVVALLAACLTAYLAIREPNMPLLRRGLAVFGQIFKGQTTQRIDIDVHLEPPTATLSANIKLSIQSREEGRQRFYFFLNPGLRIREVHASDADGALLNASLYRLWGLAVVDIGKPLRKDEHFQLHLTYGGSPSLDVLGGANVLDVNQVLLNVDSFWYPVDAQSFFDASVHVTLPANLTVVYHGAYDSRAVRGEEQEVRWETQRPVAGIALVAGRYSMTPRYSGDSMYRVYLSDDVRLDAERILDTISKSDRFFGSMLGPSGFNGASLFVNRTLRRGFNDGSGVIGLSIRYFRTGDYGLALIAHEVAHNWWGGTVTGGWLSAGTGAQWIVEGMAECTSLMATEAAFGAEALARRMPSELFDPARQSVVADMTVLDNALVEPVARDTIYRKGAWAACMLRQVIGDEPFSHGLHDVIEQHRYQQISEGNVQQALETTSGQKLDTYFADWLRSDALLDLSLDQNSANDLVINNLGKAAAPAAIEVWTFKKRAAEPLRSTVKVGDILHLDPDIDSIVLDPRLQFADVTRENNRYPRREDPFAVAATSSGVAIAQGSQLPWGRAAIRSVDANGAIIHTWELERGLLQAPVWAGDGKSLIVSNSAADGPLPYVLSLAADGARRSLGRGLNPAPDLAATIYAAQDDRLIRFAQGKLTTLLRQRGTTIEQPLPSPDGKMVVYTASRRNHTEVRAVRSDGSDDRLFMSWDRDRTVMRWAPDSSRLYAVIGGDWDWQLWELPWNDAARVLAKGAASIGDIAVSPDGKQLALTAAAALDYPRTQRQLIVMNLGDRSVKTLDVGSGDVSSITWPDQSSVLAIVSQAGTDGSWSYPERRTLLKINATTGNATAWP